MQLNFLLGLVFIATVSACPDGWVALSERCLYFSNRVASYVDASAFCNSFGSRLAEPLSLAESHFLGAEVNKGNISLYYIGITDIFKEGEWVYSSSEEVVPFTDWGVGEPIPPNAHEEDCLVIAKTPQNKGHWADVQCKRLERFICEKSENIVGQIIG